MQKVLKLQIALKAGILVLWCMFRLVLEAMHWRQNHSWCQELPSRRLPCANHFQGWFFVLKITVGYHWEIIDMVKNLKMLSIQVVFWILASLGIRSRWEKCGSFWQLREKATKRKKKHEKGKMRRISGGMSQKGTCKEK